jgi:hypothetical protein
MVVWTDHSRRHPWTPQRFEICGCFVFNVGLKKISWSLFDRNGKFLKKPILPRKNVRRSLEGRFGGRFRRAQLLVRGLGPPGLGQTSWGRPCFVSNRKSFRNLRQPTLVLRLSVVLGPAALSLAGRRNSLRKMLQQKTLPTVIVRKAGTTLFVLY